MNSEKAKKLALKSLRRGINTAVERLRKQMPKHRFVNRELKVGYGEGKAIVDAEGMLGVVPESLIWVILDDQQCGESHMTAKQARSFGRLLIKAADQQEKATDEQKESIMFRVAYKSGMPKEDLLEMYQ